MSIYPGNEKSTPAEILRQDAKDMEVIAARSDVSASEAQAEADGLRSKATEMRDQARIFREAADRLAPLLPRLHVVTLNSHYLIDRNGKTWRRMTKGSRSGDLSKESGSYMSLEPDPPTAGKTLVVHAEGLESFRTSLVTLVFDEPDAH